ncbi:MAG: GTP-binding protein [Actinobacteria bacterium]|nr:GTP-binding protein [Actinomycetota bacterium]
MLAKILIVGDSGVGKSSLMLQYVDGAFNTTFTPTLGVDFSFRRIVVKDMKVKMQIWDTAGQERFRYITSSYYRGSSGVLIVYDVCDATSFKNIPAWYAEIKRFTPENTPIILVGNKADLSTRVIESSEGKALADSLNIPFLEVSAKTGDGVEQIFQQLAEQLIEHKVNMSKPFSNKKLPVGKKPIDCGSTFGWCKCAIL